MLYRMFVIGSFLTAISSAYALDRAQVIREIKQASENLNTASFYGTFEVERNLYGKGQKSLSDFEPIGWNQTYPREAVCRYACEGEKRFVDLPTMVVGFKSGKTTYRMNSGPGTEEISGWEITEDFSPDGFIRRFGLDPMRVGYFVDDPADEYRRPMPLLELAERKDSRFQALAGGKVALVSVFHGKFGQDEIVAVLDPARGYLIDTLTDRQKLKETSVTQDHVLLRVLAAKRSGKAWVPTRYIVGNLYGLGAERVTFNDTKAIFLPTVFDVEAQRGDSRIIGRSAFLYSADGSWKPMPSAKQIESRRENAKEVATMREYFLWVVGTIAVFTIPTVLSILARSRGKPFEKNRV